DVTVLDGALLGPDPAAARHPVFDLTECRLLVLVDPRRPGPLREGFAASRPGVGFLAQTSGPEQLLDAVRRMHQREQVLDDDLAAAAARMRRPLTAPKIQ